MRLDLIYKILFYCQSDNKYQINYQNINAYINNIYVFISHRISSLHTFAFYMNPLIIIQWRQVRHII